ncbi:MAG: DUF348 domain-containing protein [Firmicutes bacterium]|nr:DUF348 domain-containing protein [Bacillota bacterium]
MKRRTAADLLMQDLGELTEASVVDLTADAAAEAEPVAEVEEQVIIEEPAAPEPPQNAAANMPAPPEKAPDDPVCRNNGKKGLKPLFAPVLLLCLIVIGFGATTMFGQAPRMMTLNDPTALIGADFDTRAAKQVTVVINGQEYEVASNSTTVGALLQEMHIELSDQDTIDTDLSRRIRAGMVINVGRSFPVTVHIGRIDVMITTTPGTIREILAANDIELGEMDIISPDAETVLYTDGEVSITRVRVEQLLETEEIEPPIIYVESTELMAGEMRQSSIGLPGERESVYEITYHNNEEISRVLTEENITVEAEPMVIEYGTSLVGTDYVSGEDAYAFGMKTATTAGGVSFAYLETRDIIATGYCYTEESYETLNVASYGYGTMIVDPQIIPLGSVVYVENYGFAVASGTSEYVVNNSILLGFDTVEQAEAFGTWEGSAYVISIPTL